MGARQQKDNNEPKKVIEYITPAIRIRDPRLLKERVESPQSVPEVESMKSDKSSPKPIGEGKIEQPKEKIKSPRSEHIEIVTENEPIDNENNEDSSLTLDQLYSAEEVVVNEAEMIVDAEVEVETVPIPEDNPFEDELSKDGSDETSFAVNDRPFRAAAATAQAIAEAQQEFMSIEPPPEFKRNSRGEIELLVDKPIKPRKYTKRAKLSGIDQVGNERAKDSYDAETASQGSYNPNLQETTLSEFPPTEEEVEESYVEKSLSYLLENIKNQYMGMIQSMQDPLFSKNIEQQIRKEKSRNEQLSKRVDQLESQIET